MPEENEKVKFDSSESLIDVGETTGAEITLDEQGEPEKVEAPVEETIEVEQVEQPVEAKKEEPETKKDELEEYSKGVQSRIAKLTRKMREAERQKEEAIAFAEAQKIQKEEVEGRFSGTFCC